MLIFENSDGELLLEQRPQTGLWGGLWSFPECDEHDLSHRTAGKEIEVLAPFRHTFTHFHLDITPVRVQENHQTLATENNQLWFSPLAPSEIGLTRPVTKLLDLLY